MTIAGTRWDPIRAELGDTYARARRELTKKPCTVCGAPTAAVSGVCPRHVLERAERESTR